MRSPIRKPVKAVVILAMIGLGIGAVWAECPTELELPATEICKEPIWQNCSLDSVDSYAFCQVCEGSVCNSWYEPNYLIQQNVQNWECWWEGMPESCQDCSNRSWTSYCCLTTQSPPATCN